MPTHVECHGIDERLTPKSSSTNAATNLDQCALR